MHIFVFARRTAQHGEFVNAAGWGGGGKQTKLEQRKNEKRFFLGFLILFNFFLV